MDLTTFLTSLGGKSVRPSWRTRTLPESQDFAQMLAADSSPGQNSLMAQLIDQTKDELISKALLARGIMK